MRGARKQWFLRRFDGWLAGQCGCDRCDRHKRPPCPTDFCFLAGKVAVFGQGYVIGVLGFFATLPPRVADADTGRVDHRSPTLRGQETMAVSKADLTVEENVITLDRRAGDRRTGQPEAADTSETKTPRRKKQRRRHIDPTTCERDYSDQEIEFMRAMDDYKRDSGRMFPTCSEVLEVIRALGYRQLNDAQIEEFDYVAFEEADCDESQDLCEDECEEEFADA